MAKKSRTSKKTSNDNQKKLLALVLIILFVGLGVFLVVSSFAAKGGKGKPGGGTTFVDSPYTVTYKGAPNAIKYPNSATFQAIDKITGALLNPMPEGVGTISGACYATGSSFSSAWNKALVNGEITITLSNPEYALGANCTAYLNIAQNGSLVPTASVNFNIAP